MIRSNCCKTTYKKIAMGIFTCDKCGEQCDLTERPPFTNEQIDWICYQIGDWYLDWKDRICNHNERTHSLGYAKERLKMMICGDKRNENEQSE